MPKDVSGPSGGNWMNPEVKTTITLVNGRCDFDKEDPSHGPSVTLAEVHYGYLTMSGQLDAMVVLTYHTGGSANWNYLYAFSLASGSPRLLGWFQTGDRASYGLYRLIVSNGEFILDVLDPGEREADCCSAGFIRTRYEWRNGMFVAGGPPRFGRVEKEPKPKRKTARPLPPPT